MPPPLRLVLPSSFSLHPRISRSDFYAQRPVDCLHFELFWARNEHHISRLMWISLKICFFPSFFVVFFTHTRIPYMFLFLYSKRSSSSISSSFRPVTSIGNCRLRPHSRFLPSSRSSPILAFHVSSLMQSSKSCQACSVLSSFEREMNMKICRLKWIFSTLLFALSSYYIIS